MSRSMLSATPCNRAEAVSPAQPHQAQSSAALAEEALLEVARRMHLCLPSMEEHQDAVFGPGVVLRLGDPEWLPYQMRASGQARDLGDGRFMIKDALVRGSYGGFDLDLDSRRLYLPFSVVWGVGTLG